MTRQEVLSAPSSIATPPALQRDVLATHMDNYIQLITPDQIDGIGRIVAELDSPEFQGLIDQGQITVAMVRPQANESKLGGTDGSAAQHIIEEIKSQQDVVFGFSCVFSRRMCESFYKGSPMEQQLTMRGIRTPDITRWEEFVRLMTAGPTTVLILKSQAGDAIPRWNKQKGVLDRSKCNDLTIRGKFTSDDNYNNLVHGSDSIESVHREIQFFRNYLAGIAKSAKNR